MLVQDVLGRQPLQTAVPGIQKARPPSGPVSAFVTQSAGSPPGVGGCKSREDAGVLGVQGLLDQPPDGGLVAKVISRLAVPPGAVAREPRGRSPDRPRQARKSLRWSPRSLPTHAAYSPIAASHTLRSSTTRSPACWSVRFSAMVAKYSSAISISLRSVRVTSGGPSMNRSSNS